MKYSIWLQPPEPVFSELQKIIKDLARQYNAPVFEPHMTVLGGFEYDLEELVSKVKTVTSQIQDIELSLGPVSFSTTYYQSVFVRVNSSAVLMQLNLDVKKALGFENELFMPHVSLLYGKHDMATREKIVYDLNIKQTSFIVKNAVIVPVTDNEKDWKPVSVIPFGEKV